MNDFGRLLDKEIPRLRRYAFALTRNMSRADDLVQDTLVRAIAKQHCWQWGTNLRAWLFTIMHHQYADAVRRSVREGIAVEFDDKWPYPTAATDPTGRLSLRDLDRALARISEEQRRVILLIGLEGTSYEEAATILDVPIGTIRSRLSRGRESLRILMDRRDGTQAGSAREILRSTRFAESKSRYHTRPKYFSRSTAAQVNPTSSTGAYRFWPAKDRVDVHDPEKLSLVPESRKGTTMSSLSSFTPPIAMSARFARSIAIAALMGATMLASPLIVARADTATNAAIRLAQAAAPQNPAATGATEGRGETVEQRITTLHTALKITPGQEPLWNAVAQAMRENATAMDKIVAQARTTPPQNMTAVEDLKMYQKFAQAHIDGLKNLIVSFEKLYAAMPEAQKKITDDVFRTSGRQG